MTQQIAVTVQPKPRARRHTTTVYRGQDGEAAFDAAVADAYQAGYRTLRTHTDYPDYTARLLSNALGGFTEVAWYR